MASDAQSLLTVSRQHAAITGGSSLFTLLEIALLIQIANQVAPAVATDPQSLFNYANVNGYVSVSNGDTANAMVLALLQIIAQNVGSGGGGGGSGITMANYGGGQPNFTPPTGSGAAVDTSGNFLWFYYGGAWHLFG